MGFVESYKKGWSFIVAAFGMARENKKLLAPSLYQVLISILYWAGWIAALVAIDPQWSHGTWALVGALATFGSFLIFYFFCGVTVNMIDVHLKGGYAECRRGGPRRRQELRRDRVPRARLDDRRDVRSRGA